MPDKAMDEAFYAILKAEREKTKPKEAIIKPFWQRSYFKYAASIVGLAGAFFIGKFSRQPQIVELTKVVYVPQKTNVLIEPNQITTQATIHVVQNEKTKTKPVNIATEIAHIKEEMTAMKNSQETMMLAMLKHESASDRIQALDFSYKLDQPNEQVLLALIKTLDEDPNINVRMAAADAMVQFRNTKTVRDALIKSLLKQQEPTLQIAVINLLVQARERRALPALQLLAHNEDIVESVKQQAEESIKRLEAME